MADAGCSGSQPFKGLISHHDHDRSLPSHTTRQSATPNTFRGASVGDPGHERYRSFIGESGGLPASMPALAPAAIAGLDAHSAPLYRTNMAAPLVAPQPSFPTLHTAQYRQNVDHPRQQEWAREYLQSPSTNTAGQSHQISHGPGLTSAGNYPMLAHSPSVMPGSYNHNHLQTPYIGHRFPMAEQQQIRASEHGGEIGAWMGTHNPSGVAIEDVDQVLAQISAELGNLTTEAALETGVQPAAEQIERADLRDLTQIQPPGTGLSSVESETPGAGADRPSAVSDMARKILQAVDHEDGEKWRESSFLALMRDFRDGRKDVAENSIQEVRGGVAAE